MPKILTLVFLLSIITAVPAHSQLFKKLLMKKIARTYNSHLGESADEIRLPDSSNVSVSLSQFKGKIVLLNFWSTSCGPCIAEIPSELKFHSAMKSSWDSLVWINVSTDKNVNKWKNFIKKTSMPGISLIDTSKQDIVAAKLHVDEYPMYILLDKQGKVIGHDIPTTGDSPVLVFYLAMRASAGIRSGDAMREIIKEAPVSKPIIEQILSFHSYH